MKNFTSIIILLIVFALCVNLVIFLIVRRKNLPVVNVNDSMEKKIEAVMQKQFEVEHRPLVLSSALADSLQMYVKDNTLLVFHFDNHSCNVCVSNAIADLLSYKEHIGKQRILVIVSEDNQRKSMLLISNIKDHFNILWIKSNELMFEGINENLPIHFFLLDRAMIPFCLYFYMPEFPALNREYFNIIAKRILHSNVSHL